MLKRGFGKHFLIRNKYEVEQMTQMQFETQRNPCKRDILEKQASLSTFLAVEERGYQISRGRD